MSRKPRSIEPAAAEDAALEVSQAAPTAPPLRDANGFELDSWGLPIVGPVRAARLAELGLPDPNEQADAWPDDVDLTPVEGLIVGGDARGDEQQTEKNDG